MAVDPLEGTCMRIMVVFAHADDAEFTSGGTIARWAAEGHQITYVVCTDGANGSDSPNTEPAILAKTRREEQLAAARVLGVEDVRFLDHPDGELDRAQDDLRVELIRLIPKPRQQFLLLTRKRRIGPVVTRHQNTQIRSAPTFLS